MVEHVSGNRAAFLWVIAFLRMIRPLQLVAVSLVYLLGAVLAVHQGAELNPGNAFWGYLALISAAMSIHLANEYSDFDTDFLTERTQFSGGSGALQEIGLEPRGALRLAWLWLIVTGAIVLIGFSAGKLFAGSIVVLGLGLSLGWMYSLPPLKLAWNGWGEALNAFLGGLLLPLYGAAIVHGRIDSAVLVIMAPFALLTFNNLLATTYADRVADQSVGKFTLATQYDDARLRWIYIFVSLLTALALLFIPVRLMPVGVKLASFLAAPVVFQGWRDYTQKHNPVASVSAMVVLLAAQLFGYLFFGNLLPLR